MGIRDTILESADLTHEDVEVPEWGVTLRVKSPTVKERGALIAQFGDEGGKVDYVRMYPALLIATVVDPETGEPVFTADDAEALTGKSGRAVERVAQAALRVAGMTEDAVAEGKGA